MKRWLSLLLTFAMLLALCVPVAMATPISEIKYDQVPTNVHWSEDGDLMWESDYFTNYPEDFRGFQIKFRYTTDNVEGVTNLETLNWTEHYIWDYGNYRDYVTACPNMGDFDIPADAWYCFAVCAYGETDCADDGYAYWYYSEWSDWSEPMYFAKGDAMAPPANVKWVGATMNWTVDSVDNIDHFEVQVYYTDSDGYDCTIRQFSVYPQYQQTVFCETLEEHHIDEDDLLYNGSHDYYFKVRAVAENTLVSADSDWTVSSNTLTFNANGEKLATPAGLAWEGTTMTWNKVDGVAYDVELYVKEELSQEELEARAAELGIDPSELTDEMLEELGFGGEYCTYTYEGVTEFPKLDNSVLSSNPGAYTFRVRARSTDLSKYLSSEWSEKSAVKEMDGELTLSQVTNVTISSDGVLSWSWNGSDAEKAALDGFRVDVWYKETADDAADLRGNFSVDAQTFSTTGWKRFADRDGLYSFSICTETNDYTAFYDSEYTEISAEFAYDAPDPVGTLTNLAWNGSTATWTFTGNADLVEYYYVELYYYGTDGTDDPEYAGGSSVYGANSYTFGGEYFENWGDGVYKFEVRAYSGDTDTAAHSDWVESPTLTYAKPSVKLDAPTGLYWDGKFMKWDVPADTSKIAYYKLRYVGSNELEGNRWTTVEVGEFKDLAQWLINVLGDNITFMLRAVSADATAYADSDWVICGTCYVKPAGMNAPTDLAWNGTTMTWNWDGGEYSNMLERYMIALYYAANANETPRQISMMSVRNSTMLELNGWAVNAEKSGLYYFTVYAQSWDDTVIGDSEPSAMSPALSYTPAEKLAAPSNVAWNGTCITWTHSADWEAGLVDYYKVFLYKGDMHVRTYWVYGNSCRQVIPSEVFEGAGTYKVIVQAMSDDYAVRSNSVAVSSANLTYTPATASLSAPTNVKWNNTVMTWDAVTDGTVGAYQVYFYNPVNGGDYYEEMVIPGEFPSLRQWHINNLGDTIYFKVRALTADANAYNDSEWVECQQTYTLPEALPTPTDVRWEDGVMRWNWTPENDDQANALDVFELELYYAETETGTPTFVIALGTPSNAFSNWQKHATQDGWYFFRIKAVSGNISAGSDSEWSAMSAGIRYDAPDPVAAPTNVKWSGSTVQWTASADDPEMVRRYRVELYYCGTGTEPLEWVGWGNTRSSGTAGDTLSCAFASTDFDLMGNGNYRASIYAYSLDYGKASDSEVVWSDVFVYTKPAAKLATPTGLRWEDATAKWDLPADTSNISAYIVDFFDPANPNDGSRYTAKPGEFPELTLWELEEFGTTIGFSVYAVTNNANVISDSAVATCADHYIYTEPEQLGTPGNFSYDPAEGVLTWDVVEHAYEYRVDVFWRANESDDWTHLDNYGIDGVGDNVYFHPKEIGYYMFTIYARSGSLKYSDSETVSCQYLFNPNLPKLAAPTELLWGKEYDWVWDNAVGDWVYDCVEIPGAISWKNVEPNQSSYRVCIYRVGTVEPIREMRWSYSAVDMPEHLSDSELLIEDLTSGTYYFTVQAIGDNINYVSSEVAVSDNWVYTRPEQELPVATNPKWDENVMTWTASGDMEDYYGFEMTIYFSETQTGTKAQVGHHTCTFYATEQELPDIYMMENGPGYYWFTVRGISRDITKKASGAWSVMSDAFCLTKSVEDVNSELEEIIPDLPEEIPDEDMAEAAQQVAEAVDAVKEMNTNDLANAMAADQGEENGTLALIETLEEQLKKTGGATSTVDVTDEIADTFDAEGVSVVGAALNAGENTNTVKLEISSVDEEVDLNPTLYTSAVQFSMHLTDGVDADPDTAGQQLAVPVRITLPIPANINPAFLVVLHHIESEDRYEEICPYIYQEGGKWYASFVVTSFSDFALASVTIEAETTVFGVQVTADFAVDLPGKAICAVYDEYGKLIGVTELSMTAGEQVLDIVCDPGKAHTVKLFVLDGDSVPVYVESPCVVS